MPRHPWKGARTPQAETRQSAEEEARALAARLGVELFAAFPWVWLVFAGEEYVTRTCRGWSAALKVLREHEAAQ